MRLKEFLPGYPFLAARFEHIEEHDEKTPEIEARFSTLKDKALEVLKYISGAPDKLEIRWVDTVDEIMHVALASC